MMFTTAVPLPPLIAAALSVPAVVPLPRFSVPVEFAPLASVSMPPMETVPFSMRLSVPLPPTPTERFPLFVQVPPRMFATPTPPSEPPNEASYVVVMFPVPLRLSVPEPVCPILNSSLIHVPADTLAVPIPVIPNVADPT